MVIETVKISDDNRRGFKTINKSDFIEGTHIIYGEAKPKKVRKPRKPKKIEQDDDN